MVPQGQRCGGGGGGQGTWQPFSAGSVVGNKRIDVNADAASGGGRIAALRFVVSDGVQLPANISMAAYAPCTFDII